MEILSLYLDFVWTWKENVELFENFESIRLKTIKVVEGSYKVDAYVVNNDMKLKSLSKPRDKLRKGKSFLKSTKGMKSIRSYFGEWRMAKQILERKGAELALLMS